MRTADECVPHRSETGIPYQIIETGSGAGTGAVNERGLIPFVDIAYQGLGLGLEEDAAGVRHIVEQCEEVIVAQSCDKNFSCYRDRVGSLWIKSGSKQTTSGLSLSIQARMRLKPSGSSSCRKESGPTATQNSSGVASSVPITRPTAIAPTVPAGGDTPQGPPHG